MRSSKSRSRGNKNRNLRPSGGNIINRVFDSSGPDGKVRGTPAQIIEKYTQLHRDAQLAGDRVGAENFAQHAEHYTRMLAEAQREIDRAREEQEQFNRERQAERDREIQREREARAERDREREGRQDKDRDRQPAQGERERDRDRDRDRSRYRPAEDQPPGREDRPPVREDRPQGLPAFLTHGFTQSPASLEESGLTTAGEDADGDSGLVETPEMRDLAPRSARPPRGPRPPRSDRKPEAAAAEGQAEAPAEAASEGASQDAAPPAETPDAPRAPRARKPRAKAKPAPDADGPSAEAAE